MLGDSVEYCYQSAAASHSDQYLWRAIELVLPSPGKLFDLGCGNGYTASLLVKLGFEVTAVDPSRSGIAQGKQAFPNMNLNGGYAYDDLARKYGQFASVLSLAVIEHC